MKRYGRMKKGIPRKGNSGSFPFINNNAAGIEILEEYGFEVTLVNARHVKNVPGRKSDVSDCQWLQRLHTYGLLSGSFRLRRPDVRAPLLLETQSKSGPLRLQAHPTHAEGVDRNEPSLAQGTLECYRLVSARESSPRKNASYPGSDSAPTTALPEGEVKIDVYEHCTCRRHSFQCPYSPLSILVSTPFVKVRYITREVGPRSYIHSSISAAP
jgi:hypothetical protein